MPSLRILLAAGSDDEQLWLSEALGAGSEAPACLRVDDEAACRAALEAEVWDVILCPWREATGFSPAVNAVGERPAEDRPAVVIVSDTFEAVAAEVYRLGASVCLRAQARSDLPRALEQASRTSRARARAIHAAAFESGQRLVLEQIAAGAPLADVLNDIVLLIERQERGMLCSVLLVEAQRGAERGRLLHGAAPTLPPELVAAVNGAEIGPQVGSCGTAAYRRERVIVEDIGTHPYWAGYRHLALPYGLRACWSSPIFASEGGELLGTFAMYYREPRGPTPREKHWVERATHLASIAISRDRAQQAIRQSAARYRQIVETTSEGVWLLDADARILFINSRAAEMLGGGVNELLGRSIFDFIAAPAPPQIPVSAALRLDAVTSQREFRVRRRDGSTFWALMSGSLIRDERREINGALGMLTDITELKNAEAALRQSEAEFRVVFENAAIGMALVHLDGHPVRCNPALQQFLGYDEVELRRFTLADLTPRDGTSAVVDGADSDLSSTDGQLERELDLHASLARGERDSYQCEQRFSRRNGAVVWGRLTASLVRTSAEGTPLYAIVMIENINDRRQMEEAIRSTERLRGLMYNAVTDVLFYIGVEPDGEFRFLSINPAFTRTTGLREAQVVGHLVQEVIPEPSCSLVMTNYRKAIREKRTVTWDEESVYPAGIKYGEVSITPLYDQVGNCRNLVGSVHDVTERRLAEDRIQAQAALLDQAKDAIVVRGLDGLVSYWNKGAERLYGWSSAEVLGRPVTGLVYKETSAFEAAQARLVEAGEWSGELVQQTKAGKPVVVECSWTLLRDAEGRPRSVFAINTDITERKRLEAQIFHAQRLDALGTLAGGIAHDFNNILTAISVNLQHLARGLATDRRASATLADIEQATDRAINLVRQILTFSRDQGSVRQILQLESVTREALQLLRATLPSNVVIETRFDGNAPEVLADPTQIHQIVMNLCTNAAHAIGDAGGTITITVEAVVTPTKLLVRTTELPAGRYARLRVADTGRGMTEETLERLFDPFFTTKAPEEGTGLGLSVVHGIMKNHEGGVEVTSAPGQGTTFSLYFPESRIT